MYTHLLLFETPTDFKMACDTWVHALSLRLIPLVGNSVSHEANVTV